VLLLRVLILIPDTGVHLSQNTYSLPRCWNEFPCSVLEAGWSSALDHGCGEVIFIRVEENTSFIVAVEEVLLDFIKLYLIAYTRILLLFSSESS
jgi:hypothetical protein